MIALIILCLVVVLGYRSKDYYVDSNSEKISIDGKAIGFSLEYSESNDYFNDYVNVMTHRIDKNVNYKSITFYLKDSKSGKPFVTGMNEKLDSPFFHTGKNHGENMDLSVTYVIDSLSFKIKKQENWRQLKKKKHIWFNWAFH